MLFFREVKKMRKTALTTIILILFVFVTLHAQTSDTNQEYIKAMSTQDPAQKSKLLKDWLKNNAGKGRQYENYAYAELCVLPYPGKTEEELIEYGEKALGLGGLDDFTHCRVLMSTASILSQRGQNLEKAKSYSQRVIQLAKTNKNKEGSGATPEQWNYFMGIGYYTHGKALDKGRDPRGALDSYLNSYDILKNPQIVTDLKKVGKTLYDNKFYKDAEKAFKVAATALKDYPSIFLYAKTLHRNGKKDDALRYYKQAYSQQKTGDVAFNIGIILAAKSEREPGVSPEAIKFLLEASLLSPSNSKKAMKLAESLFFTYNKDLRYNETVKEIQKKNKELEDLHKEYKERYGNKKDDELSDTDKRMMSILEKDIEAAQKDIDELVAKQKATLGKFNKLIDSQMSLRVRCHCESDVIASQMSLRVRCHCERSVAIP
jgi:tetratricopeptide (TPR) repeat protein